MTPTTHATSTTNEALLQANETLLHAITLLQDAVKKINDDLTLVKSTHYSECPRKHVTSSPEDN